MRLSTRVLLWDICIRDTPCSPMQTEPMFLVSLQNNLSENVSQRHVLWEIYFRWNMWHGSCHPRIGIVIRHQHQQSTDSDEQSKRQWVAGLSEGQHSAQQPPPHLLSTPTKPRKPKRQILLLTPVDKHIWNRVHRGPQPQSATWYSLCRLPLLSVQCRDRRKKSKRRWVGPFNRRC